MRLLYHYTSLSGILGMLDNKSIWATHVSYLNDASEFSHGLELAINKASEIFMEDDYMAAFGMALRHQLNTVTADNIYVTSFSEKPDLLSQWRGYCPAGAGLCLGFDSDYLKDFCDAKKFRLEPCIYDQRHQMEKISALIEKCRLRFPKPPLARCSYETLDSNGRLDNELNYMVHTSMGEGKPQADAAVGQLCSEIRELAPLMKNEGFNEESEWRIVAKDPEENIMYRSELSYLAPYIELKILSTPSALREVIIGPNPNQHRCEASVKKLLESKKHDDILIKKSNLPFNSW